MLVLHHPFDSSLITLKIDHGASQVFANISLLQPARFPCCTVHFFASYVSTRNVSVLVVILEHLYIPKRFCPCCNSWTSLHPKLVSHFCYFSIYLIFVIILLFSYWLWACSSIHLTWAFTKRTWKKKKKIKNTQNTKYKKKKKKKKAI